MTTQFDLTEDQFAKCAQLSVHTRLKTATLVIGLLSSLSLPDDGRAAELRGPARFCGYSPIIDLLAGERVVTLDGGIHGGSFEWEGGFGTLHLRGIGWASRPRGRVMRQRTNTGQIRFSGRREDGRYVVAIWNGRHGAAYFSSLNPLTRQQLAAIDRVALFDESFGPENDPKDCKLRTTFSWE